MGAELTPRARKMCIAYAGPAYHVMARGNQVREVCGDERARKLEPEGLEKTGKHLTYLSA